MSWLGILELGTLNQWPDAPLAWLTQIAFEDMPMIAPDSMPAAATGTTASHHSTLGLNDLVSQYYGDVRGIAHARLRRLPPSRSMRTNTLLQEALLRLARQHTRGWHSRVHFSPTCPRPCARRSPTMSGARRPTNAPAPLVHDHEPLEVTSADAPATATRKLAIHQALERLQQRDRRAALVVFYRFYCGLSMTQNRPGPGDQPAQRGARLAPGPGPGWPAS